MIAKFNENEFGLEIELTPETVEETATLLRYNQNCTASKPEVFFSFRKIPYLSLFLKKKKKSVQSFSIRAGNKS